MKWLAYFARSYYENFNYYDLLMSLLSCVKKYLNGNYYVEEKDKQYIIHPSKNNKLGLPNEPKSLRTRYQFQNNTQIRKNQKVIKNENDELVLKKYPKNKRQIFQQLTFKSTNFPCCKRN